MPSPDPTGRSILDHCRDAVAVSAADRLLYTNVAFRAMVGHLSEAELVGRDVREFLIAPRDAAPPGALRDGPRRHPMRHRDGHIEMVETSWHDIQFEEAPARLTVTSSLSADPMRHHAPDPELRAALTGARIGVWEWYPTTGRLNWSEMMYTLYGFDPIDGPPTPARVREAVHPDDRQGGLDWVRTLSTGDGAGRQHRVLGPNGRVLTLLTRATRVSALDGQPWRVVGFSQDVTDQAEIQTALAASEARFRALAENSPSLITVYRSEAVVYVNPAAARITGYSESELLTMKFWSMLHPDDQARARRQGLRRQSGQSELPERFDLRVVTKTGDTLWVEAVVSPLRLDGQDSWMVELRDITDRKRAQAELRDSRDELRALTTATWTAVETERAATAREMHDELGQLLTAQKLDAAWLLQRLAESPSAVRDRLESIARLATSMIDAVRRLAASLRPPLLDEIGLVAAIEWQVRDFERRTGTLCTTDLPGDEPDLDPDCATVVFRILQEALTNVARHAGASQVSVRLAVSDSRIRLRLQDDGTGITREALRRHDALGLIGMRERATQLGGRLRIGPHRPRGTRVSLDLPHRGHDGQP